VCAGAARQLRASLLVNPRAIDQTADTLAQALAMSEGEQAKRMRLLRTSVVACDARWWAERLVADALPARRLWHSSGSPRPMPRLAEHYA
jgi:trehalose 6-phosphate synthase